MENGQKKISELFDGRKIFNIPKYQRAYAWEEKHLADFIDDFENQDINKDYFFGTILFQEKENEGAYNLIDIVDGQQRITTLIIFMKMLIDRLEGEEDDIEILKETYIKHRNEYKLRILPQDNDFFQSYILDGNPFSKDSINTPSQRKLWDARKFLGEALTDSSQNTLWELKDKVERTKVLTYSVLDSAEATLIFETTNDRGKSLTNLEKIKSFLMYKTYLVSEFPDSMLDSIQERFRNIYRDLEVLEGELDEDSILQYHFIAFEDWKSTKSNKDYQRYVEVIKNQINLLVKSKNKEETIDFIERFSRELKESFTVIRKLFENPPNSFQDILALQRVANFYPLLMKAYKYDKSDGKVIFEKVAKSLEIFSFRIYGMRRWRSNSASDRLYRMARDFKGEFNQLILDLKELLNNYCDDKHFINSLTASELYGKRNQREILYILWKYENNLRKNEQPVSLELSFRDFMNSEKKYKLSIEHIVPQNPKDSKVVSEVSILPKITEEFEELYLHSLGNLTLDPLSANQSKSNSDFDEKNSKYFQKAPFKIQNELEEFINPDNNKWDEYSISKRANKILEFALTNWKIIN
jgi:uncharacterized protein with ParB-like and HNH nuclease domain